MSKSIKSVLDENNIVFSKIWDPEKALQFFADATPEDIEEEFPFSAIALKKFIAKTFPDKDSKMSVAKYARNLLATINEPSLEDTFDKIYKVAAPFRKKEILKLSIEQQEHYNEYATNRKAVEEETALYKDSMI